MRLTQAETPLSVDLTKQNMTFWNSKKTIELAEKWKDSDFSDSKRQIFLSFFLNNIYQAILFSFPFLERQSDHWSELFSRHRVCVFGNSFWLQSQNLFSFSPFPFSFLSPRHREGSSGTRLQAPPCRQPRLAVELSGALGEGRGAAVPTEGGLFQDAKVKELFNEPYQVLAAIPDLAELLILKKHSRYC